MLMNYKIGTFTVQIDSDFPITESEMAELFRTNETGKLKCVCKTVDVVRDDYPNRIYSEENLNVYALDRGIEMVRLAQVPRTRAYLSATEHECGRKIDLRYAASDLSWSSQIGYLWRAINLRHCLMRAANLLLHSSYIDVGGSAVLFVGAPGSGKTTQAALWAKYRGATIINGDRAVIGMENGVSMAYGVPLTGSSHICRNESLPIKAVAVINRDLRNRVQPISGPRAMAAVGKNTALDKWRSGEYAAALSILDEILGRVAVFEMGCTEDERSVKALERAIARIK